tara:strand:+ start:6106 stop:6390 length:285 start_codon:yes stop_codon:yes gene_type:complete
MARKLTKALRGKRRWIGCLTKGFSSRPQLEEFLQELPVKLYDFSDDKCILSVRLEDYQTVRETFQDGRVISTTSSGKIRLVRQRLEIEKKPRKR